MGLWKHRILVCVALGCLFLVAGCDDGKTLAKLGETCSKHSDCEGDLVCLDGRCAQRATDGDKDTTESDHSWTETDWPEMTEEETESDGDSETPTDGDFTEGEAEADTEEGPATAPDAWRAIALAIESPAIWASASTADGDGEEGEAPKTDVTAKLNETLGQEVAKRSMNLLFIPEVGNPLLYPYTLATALGTRIGVEFKPDSGTRSTVELSQDGSDPYTFVSTSTATITLRFGSEAGKELVLKEARIKGRFGTDYQSIASGEISGAVDEAGVNGFIAYEGRQLSYLFLDMQYPPDYTFADLSPGYSFKVSFIAQAAFIKEE